MATNLHRDAARMAFIREHCEKVSMNEMAEALKVPYSAVKTVAKMYDLTFSHYSHNELTAVPPPPAADLEQEEPPATKKVRRGSGNRGFYSKKIRPAPVSENPVQRVKGEYSNRSPYGIASGHENL